VLDGEVLILECSSIVYRHYARAIRLEKVASLDHKVFDDTVEDGILEALRYIVTAILASAELSCCLRQPKQRQAGLCILKFSAVLGTMSLYSSILSLPIAVSPMEMSKKTIGRAMLW
jgi:hypothetical protein